MPAAEPSLCAAGFYCAATGLSAPTASCTGGYYCPAGSTTIQGAGVCPRGFSCPPGADRFVCGAGLYCPKDGSAPAPCSAGFYCPLGSFTPQGGMYLCFIFFPNRNYTQIDDAMILCIILAIFA